MDAFVLCDSADYAGHLSILYTNCSTRQHFTTKKERKKKKRSKLTDNKEGGGGVRGGGGGGERRIPGRRHRVEAK